MPARAAPQARAQSMSAFSGVAVPKRFGGLDGPSGFVGDGVPGRGCVGAGRCNRAGSGHG